MPGIGDDIKEVLNELGTTATVTRFNGTVIQEKIDYENFPTHSSEFIRQFFYTATLQYDTALQIGDPILFQSVNGIITNIAYSDFENELVDRTASIFRCNVRGVLKRYTEANNANYVKILNWQVASGNPTSLYALQYENKFGFQEVFHEEIQAFLQEQHVLVLPGGLSVREGDRWYPVWNSTSEYYRISAIETRRLGVPICTLKEDTRDA